MNRFDRERWDTMGKEALSRVEELMNTSRINELIHKREEDEKKKELYSLGTGYYRCSSSSSRYLHTQFTVSLPLIIWKILKTISMMTSTMTSSRMKRQKRRKAKRKKRGLRKKLNKIRKKP